METTIEYVGRIAPNDVRATLSWLTDEGFGVVRSRGGVDEPFGNAFLALARSREVVVLRDRSQWDISVALTPGGPALSLAVLDAARRGVDWDPEPLRPLGGPQPSQLPEGVSWRAVLPPVLAWLDEPGSEVAAETATANARKRMVERWK